jgi:hypothetical protein
MIEVCPIFSAEYSRGPYCLCSLVYSVVCTPTLRNQKHVVDETYPPHCSVTLRLTDLLPFEVDLTSCYLLPIMMSKAHVALRFPPLNLSLITPACGSPTLKTCHSGDRSPQDYLFSVHVFNPSIRLPDTDHPVSRARQYVLPSRKNLTDTTFSVQLADLVPFLR